MPGVQRQIAYLLRFIKRTLSLEVRNAGLRQRDGVIMHWWYIPIICALLSIGNFCMAFGRMDSSGIAYMFYSVLFVVAAGISLITGWLV